MSVNYRTQQVGAVNVFFREAGPKNAPVLLLLHGFPSSSHMFRELIPLLADRYRVIAPDLPGFGQTQAPDRGAFEYTFDTRVSPPTARSPPGRRPRRPSASTAMPFMSSIMEPRSVTGWRPRIPNA